MKKDLDKLHQDLESGSFKTGRGSMPLSTTKTVFYLRSGDKARLYFRYVKGERNTIEVLAESDKNSQQEVIDNLTAHFK